MLKLYLIICLFFVNKIGFSQLKTNPKDQNNQEEKVDLYRIKIDDKYSFIIVADPILLNHNLITLQTLVMDYQELKWLGRIRVY